MGVHNLASKAKQPQSQWADVKKNALKLDQKELVKLLGELYRLSSENQDFLNSRFSATGQPLSPFKEMIRDCMCPGIDGDDSVQIGKARRAIGNYFKASHDIAGKAELETYFVECGNRFTLRYGDIDEPFYVALNDMYRKAIESALSLSAPQRDKLRIRLKRIMDSSKDLGWGYHDQLREDYYEAFPNTQ